jgi:hypothetical protein
VLPTLLAFVSGRSSTAKLAFFYQIRPPASATRRSASESPSRRQKNHSPNARRRASVVRGDLSAAAMRVVYSQPSSEDGPLPGRSAAPQTPSASARGAGGAELFLADPRRHVLRGTCIYFLRAGAAAGPPSPAADAGNARGPSAGGAAAESQRVAFSSLVGRITCGDITAPVSRAARPARHGAPTQSGLVWLGGRAEWAGGLVESCRVSAKACIPAR